MSYAPPGTALGIRRRDISHGALILEKLVKLGTSLFVGAIIARALGPTLYGAYALMLMVFAIHQTLALAGIDQIFVREYQATKSARGLVLSSLRIRAGFAGLSCLLSLAVCACLGLFSGGYQQSIAAILIALPVLLVPFEVGDLINQAGQKAYVSALIRSVAALMASALRVLVVLFHPSLPLLALSVLLEYALSGYLYWRLSIRPALATRDRTLASAGKVSTGGYYSTRERAYLLIVAMTSMLYGRLDQLIVHGASGPEVFASYSLAAGLVSISHIFASTFIVTLYPRICQAGMTNVAAAKDMVSRESARLAGLGILIALSIHLAAEPIISLLYGDQYKDAVSVLKIVCFSLPFIYFGQSENMRVLLCRSGHYLVFKNVFGVILLALSSYVGLAQFGIKGAAVALVLTCFVTDFAFFVLLRRLLQ